MTNQPTPKGSLHLPGVSKYCSTIIHTARRFARAVAPAPKLVAVLDRFRHNIMPQMRHSTRTSCESILRRWIEPAWAHVPLGLIQTSDVEDWLNAMKCADKTKQHRKALLHELFAAAVRWEMTSRNPVAAVRVHGGTRRRRRPMLITLEQLRLITERLREPIRQMVTLAALLGLRASEVVALKWTDFDFSSLTLCIERGCVAGRIAEAKTESSEDLLPLHEDIAIRMLLWQTIAPKSEWVFPSPKTGRPYHQDSIRAKHLIPTGREIGLDRPLGWHTFRHSYRRWLDEAGTPLGIIKELMRHADISTTMNVYGVGTLTPAKRQAHTELAGRALQNKAQSS